MRGNKRFIYLGLLAVSAGALIVDRALRDGPSPAEAQPTRRAGRATATKSGSPSPTRREPRKPPAVSDANAKESGSGVDPSLAWLEKLADAGGQRDLFVPSLAMLSHYQTIQETQQATQNGPKPGSPEAFQTEHQLQATFVSQDTMIAVVSGRVLRLGEFIDGFRLTRIEAYRAEFRRGRDRVWLSIPLPELGQSNDTK